MSRMPLRSLRMRLLVAVSTELISVASDRFVLLFYEELDKETSRPEESDGLKEPNSATYAYDMLFEEFKRRGISTFRFGTYGRVGQRMDGQLDSQ